MTELEILLPMYWNTLAKHLIPCRLYEQTKLWGRMWAHNMLVFERMHVLLKGMVRSGKNMTASVSNTYGMYSVSQNKHRFDPNQVWANEAKSSSLSCRPLVYPEQREAVPLGIKSAKQNTLPSHLYAQLLSLWATKKPMFNRLLLRYLNDCARNGKTKEENLFEMHTWAPDRMSGDQKQLLKLNRRTKVVRL